MVMEHPLLPADLIETRAINLNLHAEEMLRAAIPAAMTAMGLSRLPIFVTPHGTVCEGLTTDQVAPEIVGIWLPSNAPTPASRLPFQWIISKDGKLRQAWPMDHVTVCPKFDNATLQQVGLSIKVSSEPFPAQEIDDSAA